MLCVTAHLSVRNENKNITINEDLPTFDSLVRSPGSTFFTEIFIPTFINSIYQFNLQESYDKIKKEENAKSREINKIFEFWWDRILKIQETNSKFFNILVSRLCMSITDSFDKIQIFSRRNVNHDILSPKQFEWRMHVCTSWLDKLLLHLIILTFSNEKKKNSYTNIDFYNEVKKVFLNLDNDEKTDTMTAIINKCEIITENSDYLSQINEILLLARMINSTETLKKSIFSVIDDIGLKEGKYVAKECIHSSFVDVDTDIRMASGGEDNIQKDGEEKSEMTGKDDHVNRADISSTSYNSSNENKRKITGIDHDENSSKNCIGVKNISLTQKQKNLQSGRGRGREEEIIPQGGWFTHSAFTPWPIGVLPGESLENVHRCPLYLLQEVVQEIPYNGKSEERINTDEVERDEEGDDEMFERAF